MDRDPTFILNHPNNRITITLSNLFYDKVAVFQATYRFTDRCYAEIQPGEDNTTIVALTPKEDGKRVDLSLIAKQFQNEVIDQQLRLELEKRYGHLRELVYEHAFSPIANLADRIKDAK